MTRLLLLLLTLLFSLSGPAMGKHSDFEHSSFAAKTPLPKTSPAVKPGSYHDKPPGWNDNWEWHSSTRAKPGSDGWRWRDSQGGEWRRHVPDKHHPEAHWDYNPNTQWNSPWSNIDNNGNFLLFTSP